MERLTVTKQRKGFNLTPMFKYIIPHPFENRNTITVYGEIDDGHPLIHFVEGITDEQFKIHELKIYNCVMEEWINEYSSYCDSVYESMRDRAYGI